MSKGKWKYDGVDTLESVEELRELGLDDEVEVRHYRAVSQPERRG